MSHFIIDWDQISSSNSEMQIIDIYPTNLIEIPLDEYDIADYAYYEALGICLSESKENSGSCKTR